MASAKALAAIALTLIIAVPIGLGYGLASHEVTYDEWVSDGSTNLSNQILNSSTYYTNDSYAANNNSQLLQLWQFPGAGVTEYHTVAPDYLGVSTNPSSLPTYSSTSSYYNLTEANVANNTAPGNTAYRIGSANYEGLTLNSSYATNLDYITITITTTASAIHFQLDTDAETHYINPWASVSIIRDGAGTWQITYDTDQTINNATMWCITTDAEATFRVVYNTYTQMTGLATNYSFSTGPDVTTSIKLGITGGDQYLLTTDETTVAVNGKNVLVGDQTYSNVNSVNVVYPGSYTQTLVTQLTTDGNYADPSQGWRIPIPEENNVVFYSWWMNSFNNASVTFLINFTGDATLYMGPANGTTSLASYTVVSADGVILINGDTLGSYSSIQAIISTEGARFVGISDWPSMGSTPVALNSIVVDGSFPLFTSVRLYMDPNDIPDISFRVDRSDVLAGYFPTTKDYTLDMDGLFPSRSYAVKLNSIGIYGDRISIGGASAIGGMFFIENGRITIDGVSVPLKGAVIRSVYNGTNYDNSISGHELPSTSKPAEIYFGGEWSLTVTADFLTENTGTREEWAPGEFAFNEDSFKGAIVLAAVAAFIGVGLYGARSGVKVGLLILICGGAALVALITL